MGEGATSLWSISSQRFELKGFPSNVEESREDNNVRQHTYLPYPSSPSANFSPSLTTDSGSCFVKKWFCRSSTKTLTKELAGVIALVHVTKFGYQSSCMSLPSMVPVCSTGRQGLGGLLRSSMNGRSRAAFCCLGSSSLVAVNGGLQRKGRRGQIGHYDPRTLTWVW